MKFKIKEILLFLLIVGGALLLRVWRYEYFPIGGETADESAWTLLGASLIQERIPASWSSFSAYQNYHYLEGIYNDPIVRPVLDHPPLFSILPGTAHSLKSDWLAAPSFKVIRLPLVLLGALNVGLFWLVAGRFFTRKSWAMVATILFMTIPSLVFGSRLVVAENLLVTWTLAVLWLSTGKVSRSTGWLLIGVSVAAVLTKMTGLIIPVSLVVYGLMTKKKTMVRSGWLGGLLGLGLFALYGAVYNWQLFVAVFATQAARELGLATLQNRLFMHPTLVKHVFFDGWKIAGLFAAVAMLTKNALDKKWLLVQLLTVVSLLLIVFSVGESTFHGWYDLALWPLLVLSLTALLQEIFAANNGLLFGLLWLLLLPAVRLGLVAADQYLQLSNLAIRAIVLAGFLPLGWQVFGYKRLMKITLAILLLVLIVSNVIPVFSLTHETYWEQASFFAIW